MMENDIFNCPVPWKPGFHKEELPKARLKAKAKSKVIGWNYEPRLCVCGLWHLHAKELDHWG